MSTNSPDSTTPFDIAYVETPRLRMGYRLHGDPDGAPMLLLHGSYATSRWWEPFLALLPDDIYAIAPDLRGCGHSDKPSTGYGIAEQADDVWAFVQTLELQDFDLVGHSSGGAMAVEFVLRHPDAARTLSLVDSVPLEGVHTPLDTLMLLEQLRTDSALMAQSLALLMPHYVETLDDYTNDDFFQQLVSDAMEMAPPLFTALAEALNRWNRFADARYITLPSLLVWGERDAIVERAATTRSLIAIPGANNLEVLHGVGHSPMIEAPLTLAERIVDFITADFAHFDTIRDLAEEPPADDP